MLSYRHAFHAGNHADVLKHITESLILRRLLQKDKPCCYMDTHAGAGIYALRQGYAMQNQEYAEGIELIAQSSRLRELLPEYFAAIKALNTAGDTAYYPGSPYIAASMLRAQDKLYLYELHHTEFETLRRNFSRDRRVQVNFGDGFAALTTQLPPPVRRGLCLIDPSYELKSDYHTVIKTLKQGLARFNVGIFALWYPVLGRLQDHSRELVQDARRLKVPLLQVEMCPQAQTDERGMCGSGMLIFNYPYTLFAELEAVMSELYPLLCGQEGSAKLRILVEKD